MVDFGKLAFKAEIDEESDEGKLWEKFKELKPDSEISIEKKAIVLDRINEVRKENGSEPWLKWNKEDSLKKLKDSASSGQGGGKSGFKFTPPRNSETKLNETTIFNDLVTKLYEKEIPEPKRKDITIEHWRLDNLAYLDLLVQVFNGQTRQK